MWNAGQCGHMTYDACPASSGSRLGMFFLLSRGGVTLKSKEARIREACFRCYRAHSISGADGDVQAGNSSTARTFNGIDVSTVYFDTVL